MNSMAIYFLLTCLTFLIEEVYGDCCYVADPAPCADGTAGTPYCGYGKCNIFGCDCDGGCRKGPCIPQLSAYNSAALFKQLDLNK